MTAEHAKALLDMNLGSGEDDWTPTPHGNFLAKVLAERNLVRGKDVLELGAGVGNHTIIMLRQEAAKITATEILPEFVETTRRNVERNVGPQASIEYRTADWLNTEGQFDLVVTNPPFCKSGKQNRRYFLDSLILDAHKRLRGAGSQLLFVQSSMADLQKTLDRMQENGYDAEVLDQEQHPFRDYYFEDETFLEEIVQVQGGYEDRDGTLFETLSVVLGTLREYTPPAGAHVFV